MNTITDTKQLWDTCLQDIEKEVSRANFSTWFKNTSITRQDNGTACIGVPNEFVKDWLTNKYHKLILKTLMQYSENVRAVEYNIVRHDVKQKIEAPSMGSSSFMNKELPLQDLYINKEDNLNPRYVFDTFIVGTFNELAFAAAQAIVNKPGSNYNPFFIYGGTGLGKTHMIQAVGNAIKAKNPDKKVHYITLEKFATDLVNSFQSNKANTFKEKYRKYDVLIIDDIQFVGKMETTQEQLFHTFNTYYESNKQIIFSSDKHPNYIPGLEERLKSRFGAGMIVDITEPDYESRLAILRTKLKEQNIAVSDEVMEYIASVISGSIRELEGSLNAVICQTRLKNKEISMHEAKHLIKNNIKPKKNVSIDEVVKIISTFYNINEASIYEKTRRKEIVHARQMVMYVLREDFNVSYPLIGQKLGGKDHTTVIHSFLKIKEDLKRNSTLAQELEQIRAMFK